MSGNGSKSVHWFQIPIGFDHAWEFTYHMGVDGLSMPLVLLTGIISTLAAIASLYIKENTKRFYILFLLLETSMLGVFLSANLLLFFIFFEVTLVTVYFLIGQWDIFGESEQPIISSSIMESAPVFYCLL